MALGVDEASQAYERAMRNIVAAGPGICRVCWGFIDPDYETCFKCGHRPDCLDVMVPITYSEHLGQMHLALRNYKDANSAAIRRHDAIRLAAILWRFLRDHEPIQGSGETCGDILDALPEDFDWSTCAVHAS